MSRWGAAMVVLILLIVGLIGWRIRRSHTAAPPVAGRLRLAWKGQARGSTTLPIELDWCPIDRTARLWAVSKDTGLVIVFYESDSLPLISHRVIPPSIPMPPRPSATVALRWAGDSSLTAFTAQSGTIDLKGTSQQSVSGMFTLTLHHPSKPDTLNVTGSFSGVPVVTKTAGCP